MPFCPSCGVEVEEGLSFCPKCGQRLGEGGERAPRDARAGDHLTLGFNIAMANPLVFAPVVIGGLISSAINYVGGSPAYPPEFSSVLFMASIITLIGSIISFILNFAAIDMARDAYLEEPPDLGRSFNYAFSRIVTFFIASIVAGLMAITIVLIPVAILMMVIIVMDDTGIGDAISQAFSVLGRDLGDVIVLLIISIIGHAILGFAPLIGGLLSACFGVVLDIAFIDVYSRYKRELLF